MISWNACLHGPTNHIRTMESGCIRGFHLNKHRQRLDKRLEETFSLIISQLRGLKEVKKQKEHGMCCVIC